MRVLLCAASLADVIDCAFFPLIYSDDDNDSLPHRDNQVLPSNFPFDMRALFAGGLMEQINNALTSVRKVEDDTKFNLEEKNGEFIVTLKLPGIHKLRSIERHVFWGAPETENDADDPISVAFSGQLVRISVTHTIPGGGGLRSKMKSSRLIMVPNKYEPELAEVEYGMKSGILLINIPPRTHDQTTPMGPLVEILDDGKKFKVTGKSDDYDVHHAEEKGRDPYTNDKYHVFDTETHPMQPLEVVYNEEL